VFRPTAVFNAFTLVHAVNDKFVSEGIITAKETDYLTGSVKQFHYRVLLK
jgi:hypothetical protein